MYFSFQLYLMIFIVFLCVFIVIYSFSFEFLLYKSERVMIGHEHSGVKINHPPKFLQLFFFMFMKQEISVFSCKTG